MCYLMWRLGLSKCDLAKRETWDSDHFVKKCFKLSLVSVRQGHRGSLQFCLHFAVIEEINRVPSSDSFTEFS